MKPFFLFALIFSTLTTFTSSGDHLPADEVQKYLSAYERHIQAFSDIPVTNAPDISILKKGLEVSLTNEQLEDVIKLACQPPGDLPFALQLSLSELADVVLFHQTGDHEFLIKAIRECSPVAAAGALYISEFLPTNEEFKIAVKNLANDLSIKKPDHLTNRDYSVMCAAIFQAYVRYFDDLEITALREDYAHVKLSRPFYLSLLGALVQVAPRYPESAAISWIEQMVLEETSAPALFSVFDLLNGDPALKARLLDFKKRNLEAQLEAIDQSSLPSSY